MNLSKREQIIVAMALLAAIYAGWQFLFSGSKKDNVSSAVENKRTEDFLMEVARSLAGNHLTDAEKATLEKVGAKWPSQPFVSTDVSDQEADADASSQPTAALSDHYTGYIEVGDRRLAIIGDTEYEIGDKIGDSQFTVRGISMEQVLMEDAAGRRYSLSLQDGANRDMAHILLQLE